MKVETKLEYQEALNRIEIIFDAKLGTPESKELNKLADLVEQYEKIHYPIERPKTTGEA